MSLSLRITDIGESELRMTGLSLQIFSTNGEVFRISGCHRFAGSSDDGDVRVEMREKDIFTVSCHLN